MSSVTNGGEDWRARAALFSTAVPKGGCSAPVKAQSCSLQAWQGTPGMWMVTLYFLGFLLLATCETILVEMGSD